METSPPVNSRAWLDKVLRTACKLDKLRDAQLDVGVAIVNGRDVFCVNSTGSGKTVILHSGPLAAQARGEKGIALQIVPTKVLAEQHVSYLLW